MYIKQQLALAIPLNHELTFEEFSFYGNEWLKPAIQPLLNGEGHQFVYVWGEKGCGKSHFLQALCHAFDQKSTSIYLPLDILKPLGAEILDGLDTQDLICIDNIDIIAGDCVWEEAIFHLYNRIKDTGHTHLVISATHPAQQTALQLPDLKSRLTSGLTVMLKELDDEHKIQMLSSHAEKRGFELPSSVGQFILSRISRDMGELQSLIDKLDKASLQAKRKITIPFVKMVLGL